MGRIFLVALSIALWACSDSATLDIDRRLLTEVRKGDVGAVQDLLDQGAHVNGASGNVPLVEAALGGQTTIARKLIERGAAVDIRSALGNTPATAAATSGHLDMLRLLLASKADPNLRTADGWAPLQIAARKGHLGMVQELLANGADVDAKLPDGNTALSWAKSEGYDSIATLLEGAAAK